jgi:ribonuclease P protein component
MPSECFKKSCRLRRRGEFTRVFEHAQRAQGRYLTVLMTPNTWGRARLGIVASRKLGDAVRRNRAKRVLREVFRRTAAFAGPNGVDIVVIPRRELLDAAYPSLDTDFRGTVNRCAARLAADGRR